MRRLSLAVVLICVLCVVAKYAGLLEFQGGTAVGVTATAGDLTNEKADAPTIAVRSHVVGDRVVVSDGIVTQREIEAIVEKHGEFRSLQIGLDRDNLATVTADAIDAIAELENLEHLSLYCEVSADAFRRIERSQVRNLGLVAPSLNADASFRGVAAMPNLRGLSFRYMDFSKPISEETYRLIASLSGKAESLSFGEFGETEIHRSMLPAIAAIESLTLLEIGSCDCTFAELKSIEAKLPYLGSQVSRFNLRETSPIQFRRVDSTTEMYVLLRRILGPEALKVKRSVLRMRAGIDPTPQFDATLDTSEILEGHFEVKLHPISRQHMSFIRTQYPALNQQIHDYFVGRDVGE